MFRPSFSSLLGAFLLTLSGLVVAGILGVTPTEAASGTRFPIIKTAKGSEMYVQMAIGRYKIKDADTWDRWGFSWNDVRVISDQEMAAIPRGPDIGRLFQPFGDPTVYVVDHQTKRAVSTPEALMLSGYGWGEITRVEGVLVNTYLDAGPVIAEPLVVRDPRDGKIYYVNNGKRYHIKDPDTWSNWGFSGYTETPLVTNISYGGVLTRAVRPFGDPTVWIIEGGKRRALASPDAMVLAGYSWSDIVEADASLITSREIGALLTAPRFVKLPGTNERYLVADGKKYQVATGDMQLQWGIGGEVLQDRAGLSQIPAGPTLTRLVQSSDGAVWRVKDGKRKLVPSAGIFDGYGFSWSDVIQAPSALMSLLIDDGVLDQTVETIAGLTLPYTTGKTGLEQHLRTTLSADVSDDAHYSLTGVPTTGSFLTCGAAGCIRNGVAGTGAFGLLDPTIEKYYITMRWNYCTWSESSVLTDNFGRPTTLCTSLNGTQKSAHYGKKVIVTNTRTGKKIVAAVGESGPAIWVTRERGVVAGLSPEGVDALQANYNASGDTLTFGWAADQNLPLGPLNF